MVSRFTAARAATDGSKIPAMLSVMMLSGNMDRLSVLVTSRPMVAVAMSLADAVLSVTTVVVSVVMAVPTTGMSVLSEVRTSTPVFVGGVGACMTWLWAAGPWFDVPFSSADGEQAHTSMKAKAKRKAPVFCFTTAKLRIKSELQIDDSDFHHNNYVFLYFVNSMANYHDA